MLEQFNVKNKKNMCIIFGGKESISKVPKLVWAIKPNE